MHHLESWEHSWHYFPTGFCLFMFIILTICFIYFVIKRRPFFNRSWLRQNFRKDWFSDCYRGEKRESARDILKKRYARGEISKNTFEQMKKDITDLVK